MQGLRHFYIRSLNVKKIFFFTFARRHLEKARFQRFSGGLLTCFGHDETSRGRVLYANQKTRKEVQRYVDDSGIPSEGWLFTSRRSDGSGHISEVQAYRILRDAGTAVGLNHIGTHTMRKTFGYHYYRKTHDVATLMRIFNYSAPSVTLRYIGIEREQIEDSLADFYLL